MKKVIGKFAFDQVLKESGNRTDGFINIAQKADMSWFQIPMIVLEGNHPGPTLLIDAATHGDEQEGTEAIIQIAKELEHGDFAGTVVCIPVINVESFTFISRTSISDGMNLNRVYPGDPAKGFTERLAHTYVERVMKNADYAITFHGGGNVLHLEPIVAHTGGDSALAKATQGMGEAFNFKYQWRGGDAPFGGHSAPTFFKLGVPHICVECGSQCGRLYDREKNIQRDVQGVRNVMGYLKMTAPVAYEPVDKVYVRLRYLYCTNGGIHKIVKKQNEFVKKGETLNIITDMFGNVVEEVKAPFDGIVNGFWSVPVIHPCDWSSLFMEILDQP